MARPDLSDYGVRMGRSRRVEGQPGVVVDFDCSELVAKLERLRDAIEDLPPAIRERLSIVYGDPTIVDDGPCEWCLEARGAARRAGDPQAHLVTCEEHRRG